MTTALESTNSDVATARSSIRHALAYIEGITSPDQASEAHDRVKLAKQWAKIRKISAEIARDLVALEIACLRKIVEVGGTSDLPNMIQGVAKWWAEQPAASIPSLLDQYGHDTVSAKTVRDRCLWDLDHRGSREYVASGGQAQDQEFFEADMRDAGLAASRTYKTALADLVQEFVDNSDDEGFDIAEIAEDLMKRIGLDLHDDSVSWGERIGTFELCRKAVLEAPSIMIGKSKAPAFITCFNRANGVANGDFIRVPFRQANLWQLADMVELRRRQAADAQRAADRLVELHALLEKWARKLDPQHWEQRPLGDVVASHSLMPHDSATEDER